MLLTGVIFLGVGLILMAVGVIVFVVTKRFLARGVAVDGILQGYEARAGSEGGTSYHPVVQYTTIEGQTHRYTSSTSAGRKWQPGDTVPIEYDPERPDKARITTFMYLWFFPGFMVLLGGGFVIAGAILSTLA